MAECVISRATVIPEEVLNPINPVQGYCIYVAKVQDSSGKPIANLNVQCKDGSQTFNYATNEKGKVRFSTNSGSVNIYINNVLSNGVILVDQDRINANKQAAPVGTVINANFKLNYVNNTIIKTNNVFQFRDTSLVDMWLCGGGGGGGSALKYDDSTYGNQHTYGGGGGGGAIRSFNNILVTVGEKYPAYAGGGGSAGKYIDDYNSGSNGSSGGTTSFLNKSAIGGGGGRYATESYEFKINASHGGTYVGRAGKGGEGTGGDGSGSIPNTTNSRGLAEYKKATNSSFLSIGGGGGASGYDRYNIRSESEVTLYKPYGSFHWESKSNSNRYTHNAGYGGGGAGGNGNGLDNQVDEFYVILNYAKRM